MNADLIPWAQGLPRHLSEAVQGLSRAHFMHGGHRGAKATQDSKDEELAP